MRDQDLTLIQQFVSERGNGDRSPEDYDAVDAALARVAGRTRDALTQGTQCGRIAGPYARGHFCNCPDDECMAGWEWPRAVLVTGEVARGTAGYGGAAA